MNKSNKIIDAKTLAERVRTRKENLEKGIKELNITFIIDTSGSMKGRRIQTVNATMNDVVQSLRYTQWEVDAQINVSVLTFSNDARWMYPDPVPVKKFIWSDIGAVGGTNLALAYQKLSVSLEKSFYSSNVLILMTDGEPASGWESSLSSLKKMPAFNDALRYAVAIEIDKNDRAAMHVLREFVGGTDAVLRAEDVRCIREAIKVIAVTATQIKTKHAASGGESDNDLAKKAISEGISGISGIKRDSQ